MVRFMTYGIGQTSLVKSTRIAKEIGLKELYLKLEGENPTGTHKDRLAIQHVDDAIIRGYDTISVGSCGNYGVAMSFVACKSNLACRVYLPRKYSGEMIETIKGYGAQAILVEGSYEDAVIESRRQAENNGWYDANPGTKNTPTALVAYVDISEEILEDLGETPSTVSIPMGNGTTLAGVHLGFRLLWHKKRATSIPRMIGVSSQGNNSITHSFSNGLHDMEDLEPGDLNETEVNEPLLNWHAYDGQEALNAIYDTHGMAVGLTDREMLHYNELLKEEGISSLPASASALGGLKRFIVENGIEGKHVVLLTSGVKNVRNNGKDTGTGFCRR